MKNRYAGINPHLNSLLQTPGTDSQPAMWPTLHFSHIAYITDFLNRELPDRYLALSEASLQKREIDNGEIEFEGDDYLTAAIIRDLYEQPLPGKIVTRIELLSPANKPGGIFFSSYRINRIKTLQTNTPLIEIDLLHETPSLMISPPRYPNEPGSYPYATSVYDLHHGSQHGKLSIYNLSRQREVFSEIEAIRMIGLVLVVDGVINRLDQVGHITV